MAVGALSRTRGRCSPTCSLGLSRLWAKVFTFTDDIRHPDWDSNRMKIDCEPWPGIVGFWKRFLMAEILLGDTGH